MSCAALTTITKTCDNNIGGIRQVWVWDMDTVNAAVSDFNPVTYTWDTYSIPAPPTAYEFTRQSSSYTEEASIDLQAGSSFVTINVNLVFTRREALKSKSIKILGEGQRYLGFLVLDSNGLFWVLQDLQLSAVGDGSGTAKAEGSKYSVALMGEVADFAGTLSPAQAAAFIQTGNTTV